MRMMGTQVLIVMVPPGETPGPISPQAMFTLQLGHILVGSFVSQENITPAVCLLATGRWTSVGSMVRLNSVLLKFLPVGKGL